MESSSSDPIQRLSNSPHRVQLERENPILLALNSKAAPILRRGHSPANGNANCRSRWKKNMLHTTGFCANLDDKKLTYLRPTKDEIQGG